MYREFERRHLSNYNPNKIPNQLRGNFGGVDIKPPIIRLLAYGMIGTAGFFGYQSHQSEQSKSHHAYTISENFVEILKLERNKLCSNPKQYLSQLDRRLTSPSNRLELGSRIAANDDIKIACDYIINPLGESSKVLIPYLGILEYTELHINLQEEISKHSSRSSNHHNAGSEFTLPKLNFSQLIIDEFDRISHIVYIFFREEMYSENLLVYLLLLSHPLQHFLFMILVSKARLTTKINQLIKDRLGYLDDFLNHQLDRINFPQFSNTRSVIVEIDRLRNLVTQLKLSIQFPMLYLRAGSMHGAYQGLVDFASPRFSSIFLGKPDKFYDKNDEPNSVRYATIPGEKCVHEVWMDNLGQFSNFNTMYNSIVYSAIDRSLVNLVTGRSVNYSPGNRSKILNEPTVSTIEQLNGYNEFFGAINMARLRENYEVLEFLYSFAQNLTDNPSSVQEYARHMEGANLDLLENRTKNMKTQLKKILPKLPKGKDRTNKFIHGKTDWNSILEALSVVGGRDLDEQIKKWLLANVEFATRIKVSMRVFENQIDYKHLAEKLTEGLSKNDYLNPFEEYNSQGITEEIYNTQKTELLESLSEQEKKTADVGVRLNEIFKMKGKLGDLDELEHKVSDLQKLINNLYELRSDISWIKKPTDAISISRAIKKTINNWIDRFRTENKDYSESIGWQPNPFPEFQRFGTVDRTYLESNTRLIIAYKNRIQQTIDINRENSNRLGYFSIEGQNQLIDEILGLKYSLINRIKELYLLTNFWATEMELEFNARAEAILKISNPDIRNSLDKQLQAEANLRLSALREIIVQNVESRAIINQYSSSTSYQWTSATSTLMSPKFLEYLAYIRYQHDLQKTTQTFPIIKNFSSKSHRVLNQFQWLDINSSPSDFVTRHSTDRCLSFWGEIQSLNPTLPITIKIQEYHKERLILQNVFDNPEYIYEQMQVSSWDRMDRVF